MLVATFLWNLTADPPDPNPDPNPNPNPVERPTAEPLVMFLDLDGD